jgi:hypothetical protein
VQELAVVVQGTRLALSGDVFCKPLFGDFADGRGLLVGLARALALLRRVLAGRDLAEDTPGLAASLLGRPRRAVLADGVAPERRLPAMPGDR